MMNPQSGETVYVEAAFGAERCLLGVTPGATQDTYPAVEDWTARKGDLERDFVGDVLLPPLRACVRGVVTDRPDADEFLIWHSFALSALVHRALTQTGDGPYESLTGLRTLTTEQAAYWPEEALPLINDPNAVKNGGSEE